ncbi:MAG: hypothetical protein GY718_10730 [Lentisphaerae bacterium]|nr:hypothetical protein [Lentisphaerota bacterium]
MASMDWINLEEYQKSKTVKDETITLKIMFHPKTKEHAVTVTTYCKLIKENDETKEWHHLAEFTELTRDKAIELYNLLDSSGIYMDNII